MPRLLAPAAKLRYSVALATLLILPGATAVLTDPSGDVQAHGSAGPQEVPGQEQLDLLSLTLEESDHLSFIVAVAGTGSADSLTEITFQGKDTEFRIDLSTRWSSTDVVGFATILARPIGSSIWEERARIDAGIAGATITVAVPFSALRDQTGQLPQNNDELTKFQVNTETTMTKRETVGGAPATAGDVARVTDRMPDVGVDGTFTFSKQVDLGPVALSSPSPIRYSNGEAGTTIFEVYADIAQEGTYTVDIDGIPDRWTVESIVPAIQGPGEFLIPIVASFPFAHQHGTTQNFTVTVSDGNVAGEILLGTHFFKYAQPAGHHDELWLHVDSPHQEAPLLGDYPRGLNVFLSTIQEDERGNAPGVGGYQDDLAAPRQWFWCAYLDPALQIGLLQDVQAEGRIELELEHIHAPFEGTLNAVLYAEGRDGETTTNDSRCIDNPVIAAAQATPTTVLTDGTRNALVVSPLVEFIDPGLRRLALEIVFELPQANPATAAGTNVGLAAGAMLKLPLIDVPSESVELVSEEWKLEIQPAAITLPPGSAAAFQVAAAGTPVADLQAFGAHKDWVTDIGATAFSVEVPQDAVDGQIIRIVLGSESRFGVATITIDADAVAPALPIGEATPIPGAVPVALVAAVAALMRRRIS